MGHRIPGAAAGALLAPKRIWAGESQPGESALHGYKAGFTGTGISVHGHPGAHRDGETLQEPL